MSSHAVKLGVLWHSKRESELTKGEQGATETCRSANVVDSITCSIIRAEASTGRHMTGKTVIDSRR
jgi:hypothetical protein